MRMRFFAVMLAALWPLGVRAQELTGTERARVLEAARGRYYNLSGLGVKGFTCGVKFDLGTISSGLLPAADAADRALIETARFSLTETAKGPTVQYRFPAGAVSQSQDVVAGVTMWITEIVQGFFETWPAKGLRGPIPADKQVEMLERDGDGYLLSIREEGQASLVRVDKDLLVREVVTRGRDGEIDERPVFVASPGGLVFSGNETLDKGPEGVTKVRYAIEQGQVGGVLLPSAVHLVVGEHVDVKFRLSGCKVMMGKR